MRSLIAVIVIAMMTTGFALEYVGGEEMEMISQADWGSSLVYPDGSLYGKWQPKYVVLHWGGWTEEVESDREDDTLRGWQRYHIGKGWQDIAYNYAIGESGRMYRLRGENHAGHTSGYTQYGEHWGNVGVGIVWIGGKRDEDGPSDAALWRLAQYLDERGLPVLGHVQTGKATACPGPDLLQFVEDYNNGLYKTEDNEMPIQQWHQFIEALFEGSDQFQPTVGGAEYWKGLDPDSWEWANFWSAYKKMIA